MSSAFAAENGFITPYELSFSPLTNSTFSVFFAQQSWADVTTHLLCFPFILTHLLLFLPTELSRVMY